MIISSPAPFVDTNLHATTGSKPDLGLVAATNKQMISAGLGMDENGVFAQLQRPGTRADGSSNSDFHVMRGSQGSAANTSSRRMHGRYHVDSTILRNLARCSKDADPEISKMLEIAGCDACLSGKTGRFGSEQHVPECTEPGEIICLHLWSSRVRARAALSGQKPEPHSGRLEEDPAIGKEDCSCQIGRTERRRGAYTPSRACGRATAAPALKRSRRRCTCRPTTCTRSQCAVSAPLEPPKPRPLSRRACRSRTRSSCT